MKRELMLTLKPCPFCQNKVEWDEEAHYVVCYECGFTYGTDDTMKSIIKFWNERKPDSRCVLLEVALNEIGNYTSDGESPHGKWKCGCCDCTCFESLRDIALANLRKGEE